MDLCGDPIKKVPLLCIAFATLTVATHFWSLVVINSAFLLKTKTFQNDLNSSVL